MRQQRTASLTVAAANITSQQLLNSAAHGTGSGGEQGLRRFAFRRSCLSSNERLPLDIACYAVCKRRSLGPLVKTRAFGMTPETMNPRIAETNHHPSIVRFTSTDPIA
jgi:hypothetical protein